MKAQNYKIIISPFKNISIWGYLFILITTLFLVVAYILSIYAHETFRTNAKDMGYFNHFVYLFSHFKAPITTVVIYQGKPVHFLSDHATFILPIESMLYWLLGKNVLLYLQITYMVMGALGLYKLIDLQFSNKYYAFGGALLYYLHYSLYNALSFDFHVNILAASIIPWLLFCYFKGYIVIYYVLVIISLLIREDCPLYIIMLSIFLYFSDHKKTKIILTTFGLSLLYFYCMYKFVLPLYNLREEVVVPTWRYNDIGKSFSEVILKFINDPAFFIEKLVDTPEKKVKINYLLFSGGVLFPFLHWKYVLIILPTIAIACFSNDWFLWGNLGHYNIVFSVWMPYIVITFINKFNNKFLKIILGVLFIFLYISLNINNHLDGSWTKITKIFSKEYYNERSKNIDAIKKALTLIPENASVSASSCLVPHLAYRDKIYYFPDVIDAEYIALIESDCSNRFYMFPNPNACFDEIKKYKNDQNYNIIFEQDSVCVLRKK